MNRTTKQTQAWAGQFGKEYTDRNALTLEEMELLYKKQYGITRTEMNSKFVGDFERDIRILEVGSNIGNQLLCLQNAGFNNLYGIELQSYAVELSKSRTKGINIIEGSAFDIPFKDGWFDLIFTSGVLIHIPPWELDTALAEIYRCSSKFIWGLEYYASEHTQIPYRESKETTEMLWKADFPTILCHQFPGLEAVKIRHFKYHDNDNVDVMYLLEKGE